MKKCSICGSFTQYLFNAQILNKYSVKFYVCEVCGLLQTEYPYWLQEAYEESINVTDTGILKRNLFMRDIIGLLLYKMFGKHGRYLDYGGGYGIFVRLMRDVGFDFYWKDKYSPNLVSRGLEGNHDFNFAVVSFEVFEHLVNPCSEIDEMLQLSDTIIFTTCLYGSKVPKPEEWDYYGFEHGQHLSFYSEKTLKYFANRYNLHYQTFRNIHMLSRKIFPSRYLIILFAMSKVGLFNIVIRMMKSKTIHDQKTLMKLVNKELDNGDQ